ncbi:MAG: hypothetical protein L6R39_000608 [Caloplaca ligustica]|nr:MAG: hypothetical protein L6R39_000608 [Caloplaca ligustica]
MNIKTALVASDNNNNNKGLETILRLETAKSDWHISAVESLADWIWTVRCEGRISTVHEPVICGGTPVVEATLTHRVSGKRWYDAFDRVGFYYGKTFQQLHRLLLDIKNLTCITYDAAIPASSLERKPGPEPFSMISWKPNLKILEPDVFERIWPSVSSSVGRLGKLMELVCHRQHVSKILICGSPAPESVELALSVLPKTASNTLGLDGEQELHLSEEAKAQWRLALGFSQQFSTLSGDSLHVGQHFGLLKTEAYTNCVTPEEDSVTILALHGSQSLRNARSSFASTVCEKSIEHFSPEEDARVVIDDTAGTLFSAICSDAGLFKALQTVLTSGVRTPGGLPKA